jgi:hypothetical protein
MDYKIMQKPASDGRLLHLDISKNGVKKKYFSEIEAEIIYV